MASYIKAIKALCPRLELGRFASRQRYLELTTQYTTLSPGVVMNVQENELETLAGLLLEGRPVHSGTAIYTPSINLKGELDIKVRVDKRLLQAVRTRGAFHGKIRNAENIGKSTAELVELWNREHPEDPVTTQ